MIVQGWQIAGYTYRAAEYCPACVVREVLANRGGLSYVPDEALSLIARFEGIDRGDEYSFDSDTFPKVVFGYQAEDHGSQCDTCGGFLTSVDNAAPWRTARESETA